ncbi:hypothetical protein Sjap_001493 [Stephania japonica]|uniref:MSP domain-containing protein n=1 Tax=Stephania japonica TaxID=461633 RepID=A0AAP0PRI7_9MAGN
MERLVEAFEEEVRINFELGCKCRATVRLRSLSSTTAVAFKVQTSSPHKFLVNPPTGLIPPLSQATFQVILKPQTHLPTSFPRSPSDRFLIKTAPAAEPISATSTGSPISIHPDWINSWFSTNPNLPTYDLKLKVAYVGLFLLRQAVSGGETHAAKNIIKRQKSILPELSSQETESLLSAACQCCDPDNMIGLLLEAGLKTDSSVRVKLNDKMSAPIDSRLESKGWTAIHVAAAHDQVEELSRLIKELADLETDGSGLATLDCRDKDGRTPLHLSASRGNLKCAKMLIEAGADKNAKSFDGRTALYRAAAGRDTKMAALLMEMGADPTNTVDTTGRTPLEIAQEKGNVKVIEILEQRELMLTAARRGDLETMRGLLKRGAKANHSDQYGLTTLHAAAIKGHKEVVCLLIESGIHLECVDKEGHTALHLAVEGGSLEIVELLVTRGANVNAKSKKGVTPLYLARAMGYEDITQFLFRRGACSSSFPSSSSMSSMLQC